MREWSGVDTDANVLHSTHRWCTRRRPTWTSPRFWLCGTGATCSTRRGHLQLLRDDGRSGPGPPTAAGSICRPRRPPPSATGDRGGRRASTEDRPVVDHRGRSSAGRRRLRPAWRTATARRRRRRRRRRRALPVATWLRLNAPSICATLPRDHAATPATNASTPHGSAALRDLSGLDSAYCSYRRCDRPRLTPAAAAAADHSDVRCCMPRALSSPQAVNVVSCMTA